MSDEVNVSLQDIKCCVGCSSAVAHVVTCQNTGACEFKVTAHLWESQLRAYAEKGSMKFCYACGGEMVSRDSGMVCGICTDTITFDVSNKKLRLVMSKLISASDLKYCVMCASAIQTKASGRMICPEAKCRFRIMAADSQMVTKNLQEYYNKYKIKFCYGCGSGVRQEDKYKVCNREGCGAIWPEIVNGGVGTLDELDTPHNSNVTESKVAIPRVENFDAARPSQPDMNQTLDVMVNTSCIGDQTHDSGQKKEKICKKDGIQKVMSTKATSFMDINHCVLCITQVSHSVTCQNISCNLRVTSYHCESQLYAYAENGSMKFCYACGGELENEDDIIVCSFCADSLKFDMSKDRSISSDDFKYCVICAKEIVPYSSNSIKCSSQICKFRIFCMDGEIEAKALEEWSAQGCIKFCYACGSRCREEGAYIICTSEGCSSKLLPSSSYKRLLDVETGEVNSSLHAISKRKLQDTSVLAMVNPFCAKVWKAAWKRVKNVLASKHSRPLYKIVLIGETGSGKTSLFNLLCNFNLVSELGLERSLDVLHDFHKLDIERAQARRMESKTSEAICYNVMFDELEVGIIDTPGFGDSRGFDEDTRNVQNIVDIIKHEEYLNCICLVINGRQTRTTYQLKYVLSEISATLPKSVFNNVIIIMTMCQDVTDACFDVTELSPFFGSTFEINPEHIFYIENPYIKLGKCREERKLATHNQLVEAVSASFHFAGKTLVKMLDTIKDFSEVETISFLHLYKVKQKVEKKKLYLLAEQKNKEAFQKQMDIAMKKLDGNKEYNANFKRVVVVKTKTHNTICGAPNCYSNCHEPCQLSKSMDKENLKSCQCFDKKNDYKCKKCEHSYRDHFHSEHIFEVREEEKKVSKKEKSIQNNSAQELRVELNTEHSSKIQEFDSNMEDLKEDLIASLATFKSLGTIPSYTKVLECQIYVLEQNIKTPQQKGDSVCATRDNLENILTKLKEKLGAVRNLEKDCKQRYINTPEITGNPSVAIGKMTHVDKQGGKDESHAADI